MSFENWDEVILDDIVTIKGGKRLPKNEELISEVTEHPYIRARDIKDGKIVFNDPKYISNDVYLKIKNYIVNTNDIVITIVGANIGDVAFIPEKFDNANLTENAVKLVCDTKKVNSKFLLHLLSHPSRKEYFQLVASGAAQDKLGIYKIKKTPLKIPSLETQKKIAKKLSNYDDLIENNQKQIELLEKKARLTYEEWFLRFRIDGKKLDIDEDSGLPFGWNQMNISDAVSINPRTTLKRDREAFYVPMSALSETNMLIDGIEKRIPQSGAKFKKNDTLLARITPSLENGKTGFVHFLEDGEVASGSTEFIVMRETEYVSPYYIYSLARSDSFRDLAILSMSGSDGRQRVKPEIFKKAKINISTTEIMRNFHINMYGVFENIYNLQNQNQKLKQARDILLPRLMRGMIEV